MSEDLAATEPVRWPLPAINGSAGNSVMTAGGLEQLQKEAYDEAWKKGYEEGIAAGKEEIDRRAQRFDELLLAMCEPFERLDDVVEEQLVELSIAVVKQLFRREIQAQPEHVLGVVRDGIQSLPVACRGIQVALHPDDAALVRENLSPVDGEPAWHVVEDATISLGGCKIVTETSQIDATVESRLDEVIAKSFGDQRS